MRSFNENWDGVSRKQELSEASQQVIGKYRFTPFTEGSIKGWTISIQGTGEVGYIQEPAKKNTSTTFSPYKVYRTLKASSPNELVMSALPGTETRIVSEKEIRFAPRQLLKGIAMWMDKHGKVMTESMEEVSEAELTKVGYALVVDNKIVYRGSKQQCLKKAKEHGGLKMGKVFITLTPKNIGQLWQKAEVELDEMAQKADRRAQMKAKIAAASKKEREAHDRMIKADDRKEVGPHTMDYGSERYQKMVALHMAAKDELTKLIAQDAKEKNDETKLYGKDGKVVANRKWSPVKEETEIAEAMTIPSLKHFTDLDEFARNVRKATESGMKTGDMKSYIQQMAGSLFLASRQQQDFLQGLIYSLEAVHKKAMSPSKHGNMEIMRDMETVIRELKKYQK